jgi:hypothetical protein
VTDTTIETYRAAMKAARAAFDTATRRFDEIQREERKLNNELGKLRRTITALAAMCGQPGIDSLGITDAIVEVMSNEPTTMTSVEVVKALENVGLDLSGHKNAAASAHAILTRLAEQGKVTKVEEGKSVKWRGPKYDPDSDIPF